VGNRLLDCVGVVVFVVVGVEVGLMLLLCGVLVVLPACGAPETVCAGARLALCAVELLPPFRIS